MNVRMFGALLFVCVVLQVCKQGAVGQGVCTSGTENHLKDRVVCDMFWWRPAHRLFRLLRLCFDWTSFWLSWSSPRTTTHPSPKSVAAPRSLPGTVGFSFPPFVSTGTRCNPSFALQSGRKSLPVSRDSADGNGWCDIAIHKKHLFPRHLLNVANSTNTTAALRVG